MTLRQAAQRGDGEVRYLLHAVPQDYAGATVLDPPDDVDVYFGNMFFMDRTTTGSTFHYKPFLPRIITPLNLTQTMFAPGKTGGLIRPTGGTITLSNADGALDYLLDYSWDKKPITLYMLRGISDSDTFGSHFKVFSGYTVGVSATTTTIDIVIRDKLTALDKDFPPNTYGGTGGTDGSANLKGARKPITLGKVYNVPPVLVDETNNIYQVNDGAVTSIDAVYQGGESLTLTTDYTVDASNGRFTLVSTPTGVITADVTNNITSGSYTNGAGVIILELLTTYAGLSTAGNVDVFAFSFRGADENAYEHGAYFDELTTIIDAVNIFAESCGGLVFQATEGNLQMKIPEFPTSNPLSISADPITDSEILDIEILATERYSGIDAVVNYKKNYRPLTEAELSATPDDRDFVTREWRASTLSSINLTWGLAYESLLDIVVNTTITNATDAATEAARISTYTLRDAKVYRVRMKLNPLYLEVGDAVELKSTRFGLINSSTGEGYPMLILSKFDDLEANEITMELMGESS